MPKNFMVISHFHSRIQNATYFLVNRFHCNDAFTYIFILDISFWALYLDWNFWSKELFFPLECFTWKLQNDFLPIWHSDLLIVLLWYGNIFIYKVRMEIIFSYWWTKQAVFTLSCPLKFLYMLPSCSLCTLVIQANYFMQPFGFQWLPFRGFTQLASLFE